MDVGNVKRRDGLRNHNEADEESDENGKLDGAIPVKAKWIAENVLVDDAKHTKDEAGDGNKNAEITENNEWSGGHRNEGIDCEMEKFFETIGRFARGADAINVFDVFLFEAEPINEATGDAVVLGKFVEFVDDDMIDETKIGGTRNGGFVAHHAKETIEKFTAEFWNEAVFGIMAANASDDFGAGVPFFEKLRDELWWLLAVGIDCEGCIAARIG